MTSKVQFFYFAGHGIGWTLTVFGLKTSNRKKFLLKIYQKLKYSQFKLRFKKTKIKGLLIRYNELS